MAVAKPVRLLGAFSIALFFFLLFTFVRQPPAIHTPGSQDGQIISNMERDPLLDRTLLLFYPSMDLTTKLYLQSWANLPNLFGEPTNMQPTTPIPPGSMPLSSCSSATTN